MFPLLTLVVACCVARGVHPAAVPLLFSDDNLHDHKLHSNTPFFAINEPSQHGEVHHSISFALPASEPEQPAMERFSGTAGTSEDTISIILPEEEPSNSGSGEPGKITLSDGKALMFPSGFRGDFAPIEPFSGCMVSKNLTVLHNGTPWKLLTQGQCPEGEWAVIMAECQPGCRPQPCPPGELEYKGQCVSPSDPTVCGEGQILYITLRGTIYCDCEQNHFYHPWSSRCYARRERGPCDFGSFLEINQNGSVECMPNECLMDVFEKEPESGKCYRKDFEGYCSVDILQFNHIDQTVGCLILDVRNLFDRAITRSCSQGSRIDHSGNCRQELVVPSITSLPRSLTDGCRDGAIRVQRGACRRVNSFF